MAEPRTTTTLRSQRGFALSELVLVLAVVTGLLFVAYASARGIKHQTATSDCQTELRTLKLATEQFHAAGGTYPNDTRMLVLAKLLKNGEVTLWSVSYAPGATAPRYAPVGNTCASLTS